MMKRLLFFLFIPALLCCCKSPLYRTVYCPQNQPHPLYPNMMLIEVNDQDSSLPCKEERIRFADFCISQYEVTNAQFAFFLNQISDSILIVDDYYHYIHLDSGKAQLYFNDEWKVMVKPGYENYPVTNVTSDGARYYALWLTQHMSQYFNKKKYFRTRLAYRLPSEEEWYYAATEKGRVNSYTGVQNIDEIAWYKDNSSSTQMAGKKKVNQLGLYDMYGNASEWCMRNIAIRSIDLIPPPKWVLVVAGGSYLSDSTQVKQAPCQAEQADTTRNDIGFRIVQSYVHHRIENYY